MSVSHYFPPFSSFLLFPLSPPSTPASPPLPAPSSRQDNIFYVLLYLADLASAEDVRSSAACLLGLLPTSPSVRDHLWQALLGANPVEQIQALYVDADTREVQPARLLYTLQVGHVSAPTLGVLAHQTP